MKKGKNRPIEEIHYWESMADILVGLLLCVLLIVLLLILYLIRIPDNAYVDEHDGVSYAEYRDPNDGGNFGYPLAQEDQHRQDDPYRDPDHGGGDDGDGDGERDAEPTAAPTREPIGDPVIGESVGLDRAAVYVQIVDGETQGTIKRRGVAQELYASDDALQTLSVYYPTKIDYTRFETNEDGVFFLPEKLMPGAYYLHGLTAIAGYDTPQNTPFIIDEARDWSDPFVVTVELYPARNTIRVQLKDRESGKKLSGGAFNVIAQRDVVTLDGTTRCHAGQIVDTIELDGSGYGESVPLYIGEYRLEQTTVPDYYAALEEKPTVTVQKSSQSGRSALTELSQQRTTIRVRLADALYPGQGLAGAGFTLSRGDGTANRTVTTDEGGMIRLDELQANTTYRLRQLSAPEHYRMGSEEYTFRVDSRGYIDGQAETALKLTNEIVRVGIGIRGRLFGGLVSDVNVALYTSDDELLRIWSSSAIEQIFEGLAPGEYKVVVNGNLEGAQRIAVRQTAEMQTYYCVQWTTNDIGALCIAAAIAAGLIALAALLIRRRRRQQ